MQGLKMKFFDTMQRGTTVLALSVVLILALGFPQTTASCPHPCACYVQTEVHCTFRSLAAVPARIPKHVERINLGFNSINSLSENSFAGLSKLELLMIHGNEIHAIPNGVFRDLSSLQVFKMSYNKLKVITSQTFQGLSGLMRLHIDHNKVEFIHPNAFIGLTSLRLLHLEGNLLKQLHPYTFTTFGFLDYFRLSTIKHLYLSENKINTLPEKMVESMPLLESLFLHGNPWACDCKMKWLLKWDEQSGDVLKCKKDKAYEGGQLCAMCSTPKHLRKKELQTLKDISCNRPLIYSPLKLNNSNNNVEEYEDELSIIDEFQDLLGNISLNMTDEHGNVVNMACTIRKSSDFKKVLLSQTLPEEIDVNATFSLEFECPMNRENYEKLWKLIAYYSEVPVKLQRGLMLNKEPKISYRYKQDMNHDAYYYTGVKAHLLTEPAWLMQPLISLQLNRRKSTATKVTLSFFTQFSQSIQVKSMDYQRNGWVMIDQNEKIQGSQSVIQGTVCHLSCHVKASDNPSINWLLPDGTKLKAPYSNSSSRISISGGGQLIINTVDHSDSGLYHCIAQVNNDMDIMALRIVVESSDIQPPDNIIVVERNVGEQIMLPCTAIAVPEAQLNWIIPNNRVIDASFNTSRGYLLENGTLLVQDSQVSDSGFYRCVAVNQLGADQYTVNVKVNKKVSNKSPDKRKIKMRPVGKISTNGSPFVVDNSDGSGDGEIEDVPKKSLNIKDREVSFKLKNNRPLKARGKQNKKDRRKMKAFKALEGEEDSNVAEGRRVFESRRRVNMGNKKIDPRHWADILAKVRGKNIAITTLIPSVSNTRITTAPLLRRKVTTPSPLAKPPLPPTLGPVTEMEESSGDASNLVEDQLLYMTTSATSSVAKHEHASFAEPTIESPAFENMEQPSEYELFESPDELSTPEIETITSVSVPSQEDSVTDASLRTEESINSMTEESQDGLIFVINPTVSSDLHKKVRNSFTDNFDTNDSQFPLKSPALNDTETTIDQIESITSVQLSDVDRNTEDTALLPDDIINEGFTDSISITTVPAIPIQTTGATAGIDVVIPLPQTPTDNEARKDSGEKSYEKSFYFGNGDTAREIGPDVDKYSSQTSSPVPSSRHSKSGQYNMAPMSTASSDVVNASSIIPFEETGQITTVVQSTRRATTIETMTKYPRTTTSRITINSVPQNPRRRPSGRRRLRPNRIRPRPKNVLPTPITLPEAPSTQRPYLGISEIEHSTKTSLGIDLLHSNKHRTELERGKGAYVTTTKLPTTAAKGLQLSENKRKVATSVTRPTVQLPEPPHIMHTTTTAVKAPQSPIAIPLTTQMTNTRRGTKGKKTSSTEVHLIKPVDPAEQKRTLAPYIDGYSGSTVITQIHNSIDFVSHTDRNIYPDTLANMTTSAVVILDQSLTTESIIPLQEDSLHISSERKCHHTTSMEPTPMLPTTVLPINLATTALASTVPSAIYTARTSTPIPSNEKSSTAATMLSTTKPVTTSASHNTWGYPVTKQIRHKQLSVTLYPILRTTKIPKREETRHVTMKLNEEDESKSLGTKSLSPVTQIALIPLSHPGTHSTPSSLVTLLSSVPAPSSKNVKEYIGFNQVESPKLETNDRIGNNENKLVPQLNEHGTSFSYQNKIQTNLNQKQSKEIYSGRLNNSLLVSPHFRRQPGNAPNFNQWPVVIPPHYNQNRGTIKPPYLQNRGHSQKFVTNSPLHFTNKPGITAFAADKVQERRIPTHHPATTPFQLYRPNPIFPGRFSNQGNSRTTINHRLFGSNYATDAKGAAVRIPHQGVPFYINPKLPQIFNRTRTFNRLTTTSKPLIPFLPRPPTMLGERNVATASTPHSTAHVVEQTTSAPAWPEARTTSTHQTLPSTHLMTTTSSTILQRMTTHQGPTLFIPRNKNYNVQYLPFAPHAKGSSMNNSSAVHPSTSFKTLKEMARITTKGYQTLAIPAEMDALFPCDTVGEPKPFLTWTKVSTGATMTANTKIQRFEVMKNGTFVIRNVQLQDRGQYLCTAQNQYGVDKMVITLTVVAQQPKLLVPRYRDATVYLGDTISIECRASGTPVPHISWVFPDRKVMRATSNTEGRIQLYENGSLSIGESTFTDRGIYKCIASNAAGTDSLTVRLHVAALPPIIQHEKEENISLAAGHSVYIHCSAKAAPAPTIRWILFDGTQVRPSQFVNGNLFVFPNGTLYIRSISPRDSGNYECIAANIVGAVRRVVHLTVKKVSSNAKITRSSPQKTDITYGSTLRLDCSADGDPGPRILWRLPSKRLVDSLNSFESRTRVFTNGSLVVQSVTDKDAGDYLCVARNKIGDDYVVLKVNVMMKPAKIEQKNEVNHKVTYGGDLKVDCVATGLPNPEISWSLPDGSMINTLMQSDDSGARTRRYVVFNNGTLFFNEVGMKEEGDYTCYAVNKIGQDEMRVSIKVVAEPAAIRNKTYTIINVPYGDVLSVPCEAKGEPIPKITWLSPSNRPISAFSNKYQVQRDGTLFIQKAQRSDNGNYTCVARNEAGEDKKIVNIHVNVQPPKINGFMNAVTIIQETGMKDNRKLIDCKAEGIPAPRMLWAFPEGVILPAPYYGNRITVHRNGTLDIKFLRKTDSVQLVCIGRNEGGEARLIVQLTVTDHLQKPSFKSRPPEKLAMAAGHAVSLDCSVEGVPEPEIMWVLPNGTELRSGLHLNQFYHRKNGTLQISSLSTTDAGVYRCTAKNMVGYSEILVSLKVGPKPEINNQYKNLVSIINGETLQLHCITPGHPRPEISWILPNGVQLKSPHTGGRFSIHENGSLIVRDASVYDRGTYLCKVTTEYGSSVMNVPVIVIAYPPRITSGPAPVVYTRPGQAVQLNCMTIGIPKAEITWELPDKSYLTTAAQSRLYGNKFLHPQGTLVIQHASHKDVGFYKCTAKNLLGSDSKTTYIHVF
ncbi:matrix-remodeling-associated protein 5 isoform X1 [Pleurodeles waltl]|uniref:matrix-remodeling-associated protein 5 isoform X1 n=2 Tax=Pleurodeles waltl TaxID=8319 RepID=UPI003709A070